MTTISSTVSKVNVQTIPAGVSGKTKGALAQPVKAKAKIVPSTETPEQEIARLRAENAALKASKGKITYKVSEKGAMSVYGLGRFPQTLYKSQWVRLLADMDNLKKFLADNDSLLKDKAE